jgi:hypothetical protein
MLHYFAIQMGQEGENRVEEFKSKKREWQLTPAIAVDYTDTQILNRTLVRMLIDATAA